MDNSMQFDSPAMEVQRFVPEAKRSDLLETLALPAAHASDEMVTKLAHHFPAACALATFPAVDRLCLDIGPHMVHVRNKDGVCVWDVDIARKMVEVVPSAVTGSNKPPMRIYEMIAREWQQYVLLRLSLHGRGSINGHLDIGEEYLELTGTVGPWAQQYRDVALNGAVNATCEALERRGQSRVWSDEQGYEDDARRHASIILLLHWRVAAASPSRPAYNEYWLRWTEREYGGTVCRSGMSCQISIGGGSMPVSHCQGLAAERCRGDGERHARTRQLRVLTLSWALNWQLAEAVGAITYVLYKCWNGTDPVPRSPALVDLDVGKALVSNQARLYV
ncbi:hypothetical protein JB92DRAFT_3100233 [Gautieria morchelliformis]|nr:hypothetical protein JB92DRAFT_3100233 [Gautieria morchelliformis]